MMPSEGAKGIHRAGVLTPFLYDLRPSFVLETCGTLFIRTDTLADSSPRPPGYVAA